MKKSILSIVICFAMIISLLPFVATADNPAPEDTKDKGLVLSKNLVRQDNGSYDLKLEAYATGKAEEGSATANTQFDISVVVDQSSSMAIKDIGGEWVKVKDGNNQEKTSWTIEEAAGYYYKVGDEYYPVKAMPGTIYETVTAPRIWRMIGSGHDGFTIGANGAPTHFNVPTDYYCIGSDGKPHKVWIVTAGMFLEYYAYPYYYLNDNDPIAQKAEWQNNIYWLAGVSDWDGRDLEKLTSKGLGWPTSGVQSEDFKTLVDAHRINFLGQTELTNATAKACRKSYTWFTDGDAVDGLVLPKTGTNYNQLGYVDANGNLVKIPESNTIYTEGSTVYNGNLYTRDGDVTRMQALQGALSLFTHNVAADADARGVTHNIAMVGFADNKPEGYTNTELFVNGTQENYSTLNSGLYANAFIPLNENDNNGNLVNDTFDNYISMLDTEGYTYTSYGVAMANQLFANNPIPEGDTTRQRILIIFTDGEPGKYGYDSAIANEALADAQIAKEVYGAKVYTIGLFNGKLQTEVENFMKYITSEYSTATNNVYSSNLNATDTYFYTSTADGKTYAASAVRNGMSTLDWWIDNGDGTYTWTSPKNQKSTTQGEDLREGTVYFYTGQNSSGAVYADGSGSSAVSTSSTYYTSDNKQIRYELRWYNSDGDFVDPKTSASDSNARHQQFFTIGDSTRNEDVGADEHYFLPVSNDAEIQAAFDSVTTREVPVVNIVSATELGASAELKDFISDKFDVSADPTITVQTVKGSQSSAGGEIGGWTDPEDHPYTYSNGILTVTDFDYAKNFIAYGKAADEANDTVENQGRKLVVTIEGLTPKANATGEIFSNTDDSGVYNGNTMEVPFPKPSITVGTPSAYVIDYSAKTKLVTQAKQLKGNTEENGIFELDNNIVTYQLRTDNLTNDTKRAKINSAFSSVDTATVFGTPVNVENAVSGWNQITAVPASSIYYSDSISNETIEVGDGHGYNADLAELGNSISKSAENVTGSFYFTFYGKEIDVYCTTHSEAGYVTAALFEGAENFSPNTRVGQAKTIKNYSTKPLYNTPTLSFSGSVPAVYTLKITAYDGAKYQLDGVRVYNSVESSTEAADKLSEAGEGNANYLNLRTLLLNGEGGFSVTQPNGMTDGFDKDTVSGVLFIDGADKLATKTHYDEDGNWQEEELNLYATQFDAYKANGPKNEIYLAAKNGDTTQAITFQMNTDKVRAGTKVWIGLSAPEEGNGTVSVTGNDNILVNSVMDMYYGITVPENGLITITNTGNSLISITNLKITGIADLLSANTGDSVTDTEKTANTLFMPVTIKTIRMAANNGIDPMAGSPEPEPTVEPGDPSVTEESGETDKPNDGSLVIDEPEETVTPTPTEKPNTQDKPINPIKSVIQSITKTLSSFFKSIFRR